MPFVDSLHFSIHSRTYAKRAKSKIYWFYLRGRGKVLVRVKNTDGLKGRNSKLLVLFFYLLRGKTDREECR